MTSLCALDVMAFKAYNFFMENIAGKTALVVGGSGGIGAAVLLQDETAPDFFAKLREGELTTSDFNQI